MMRFDAAVGEHAVDAEVAGVVRHVVDAAVAEMRQHVGEVQARHRDLADAHLEKRAERRVDRPACPLSYPNPAAAEKLPRFHDAACGRTLRDASWRCDASPASPSGRCRRRARSRGDALAHAVEDLVDDLAEIVAVLADAARALVRAAGSCPAWRP